MANLISKEYETNTLRILKKSGQGPVPFIGDFNIDMMNYVDGNLHDSNNHLSGFRDLFRIRNTITEATRA